MISTLVDKKIERKHNDCYMINEKAHTVPFNKLHDYLKGIIEGYAYYLTRSKQQVEDTSQEIFIRLWLRWEKLGELKTGELEDLIYVMTRNYLIDEHRLTKKERRYVTYYTHCVSDFCWHDDSIVKDGFFIYREAVKQLPFQEKAVYFFHENDYSREEIAEIVQRSPNTVNNQLRSASQKVRERLNKNFDLNIKRDGRKKFWSRASLN